MNKLTTKTYFESFDVGVEYKEKGYNEIDFINDYDVNHIDCEMFRLGHAGAIKPVYATGWRYGEFTDYGKSKNHASGKLEKGISLMEVFVGGVLVDKASDASRLYFEDREIFHVSGYWTPDIWGSDGEPLMLFAQHIK